MRKDFAQIIALPFQTEEVSWRLLWVAGPLAFGVVEARPEVSESPASEPHATTTLWAGRCLESLSLLIRRNGLISGQTVHQLEVLAPIAPLGAVRRERPVQQVEHIVEEGAERFIISPDFNPLKAAAQNLSRRPSLLTVIRREVEQAKG
jgi:hypothetical protein